MKEPVTRLDYCQYLLVSPINYTLTNFADHCEQFSHDAINRYRREERITPRLVWDKVRAQVVSTPPGYVVLDDTVLDKPYSHAIEWVRRQYRGNAKAVIKGMGVVTCVYVNPTVDQFWAWFKNPGFGVTQGIVILSPLFRRDGCVGYSESERGVKRRCLPT
jgi:hypothetical protein